MLDLAKSHLRLLLAGLVAGVLAGSACTRPQASTVAADASSSRVSHPSQSTSQLQSVQPPANFSPELADTYRQAQSGDARAMVKLAEAYEKGEGVPIDLPQSVTWLTKAADAGDATAMYLLGRMYAGGIGVEQDYVDAFDWYKRAAANGNTDAMYSLGEAYEHGKGVREDIQQAVNWYDKATLRGSKPAKAALDRLGESFER